MAIVDELRERASALDAQADELDAQGDALNAQADELELKVDTHRDFVTDTRAAITALDTEPETQELVDRIAELLVVIEARIGHWQSQIVPSTRERATQVKGAAASKRSESGDIKSLLTAAGA